MRYSVQITDGLTKSIGAATPGALLSAVAEYYSVDESEIAVEETDEGELLSLRGGAPIGLIQHQPEWPASREFVSPFLLRPVRSLEEVKSAREAAE